MIRTITNAKEVMNLPNIDSLDEKELSRLAENFHYLAAICDYKALKMGWLLKDNKIYSERLDRKAEESYNMLDEEFKWRKSC